jgi:hypothetical protein
MDGGGLGEGSGGGGLEDPGPPAPPSQPPPTGSKWEGIEVTGECGRTWLSYVLVDEVCGGTDDPSYMDYFHAPIMRDGAILGGHLYAVDATYLWVLDVSDPTAPSRSALLAGFGQPLAVAVHAGHLLIAAGDEGLIVVDVSDPQSPTRLATIDVGGPALDVWVDGDRALLATGKGGVVVVDLVTEAIDATLSVPGFAAAVASRNGRAFVAACDTFAVIDIATGSVVGQTWVDGHEKDGILIAPAKDVALVDDVAFVAAGRFGAVAIDIQNPAAPSVLGNCTEQTDLSFYASGVRDEGGQLFVAGGEWGILPLDIAVPTSTCTADVIPVTPEVPGPDEECSTEPPWDVLPWQETWVPPSEPPPGRDPIQTLPVPGLVYAFGDATRIGLRAIDVRETATTDLPKIGRYGEPRLTEGIAVRGDRLLIAGKVGGLYAIEGSALTLEQDIAAAKTARATAFLSDGRWVLGSPDPGTGGGLVHIEGVSNPYAVPETIWPGSMATKIDTVYLPVKEGALLLSADGMMSTMSSGRTAELPQAIAIGPEYVLLAAPEWTDALQLAPGEMIPLSANAAFGSDDILDVSKWVQGLPRRVLFHTAAGPVEIASLGGEAAITIHADGGLSAQLPAGDYVAGAAFADKVYLVSVDRGRYRTQLVTVALGSGAPTVLPTVGFTGTATGVAAEGDRVYVADGDRGVRVFDTAGGAPTQINVVELTPAP